MPEAGRALVYATVLYWQARELELLEGCIASLLAQELGDDVELRLTLVDNGSGLQPEVPASSRFELIRFAENRGFAGGHNVGIRHAMANAADYVLLFNSDAVAEPSCVHELVTAARSHPDAAFFGPIVVRAADPGRVESAGQSFSPRTGRHTEVARGQLVSRQAGGCVRSVDGLSGCALLVRCSALEAIGLLDESLFAYFEDLDWCLRARRAGYGVLLAPSARVRHVGQGSTGGSSPLSTFYSVRNHMVVAARYAGPLPKALVVGYHAAYLASSRQRRTAKHVQALLQGAWAGWSGKLGLRKISANWH